MKIKKVKVHNLYSYDDAEFDLDDYNVIVGANGSGKTNIVRILRMLAKPKVTKQPSNLIYSISDYQKFKRGEASYVVLKIELDKMEIQKLIKNVFPFAPITNTNSNKLRYIEIVIYLRKDATNIYPDFIIRLGNGLVIVINVFSDNYITYGDSLFNEFSNNVDSYLQNRVGKYYDDKTTKQSNVGEQQIVKIVKDIFLKNKDSLDELFKDNNGRFTYLHCMNKIIEQNSSSYKEDTILDISMLMPILYEFLWSSLIIVDNKRSNEKDLSAYLFTMKNNIDCSLQHRYKAIQRQFNKFFPELSFDVFLVSNEITEDSLYTVIKEQTNKHDKSNNPKFRLEDSASGYFEILYILSYIIGKEDSIIILDEPALNLHPIKIKQLANELNKLVEESGNQVMLITHSPYFVTYELLQESLHSKKEDVQQNSSTEQSKKVKPNLLYVRRDDNSSRVYYKPKNFKPDLPSHLFNSNIFFANCVILVEGSSDKAVLSAINDNLGNILDEYDISVVYCNDKPTVSKYIKLCKAYDIKYVAMVDDDYLFRWGKVEEDKERLIHELHDQKMKDKMKKKGMDPKRLGWINIDKINEITIEPNKDILLVKDESNKLVFRILNNNKAILEVDDKQLKLAVEKVKGNYYIYRDSNLKSTEYRDKDDIIILAGELEDELKKLGYKGENNEVKYYEFIDTLMKDEKGEGKEKIKDSKFYKVLEKAFDKIGKKEEFEEAWKK